MIDWGDTLSSEDIGENSNLFISKNEWYNVFLLKKRVPEGQEGTPSSLAESTMQEFNEIQRPTIEAELEIRTIHWQT